ncbi:MAG: hypothetical protein H6815_04345 [Phycisphaeraceae bacterium]|nr:hypothetical protein [Phycisphaerales bacterium]MCB9859662.1 hypothetical protein [Phycisphaeraceae bacterium]
MRYFALLVGLISAIAPVLAQDLPPGVGRAQLSGASGDTATPPGFLVVTTMEMQGSRGHLIAQVWSVHTAPSLAIVERLHITDVGAMPELLTRSLPGMPRRDLLMMQLLGSKDAPGSSDVIYTVNYQTWNVSTVLARRRVKPVLSQNNEIYIYINGTYNYEDVRVIDENNIVRAPEGVFEPVKQLRDNRHVIRHTQGKKIWYVVHDENTGVVRSVASFPFDVADKTIDLVFSDDMSCYAMTNLQELEIIKPYDDWPSFHSELAFATIPLHLFQTETGAHGKVDAGFVYMNYSGRYFTPAEIVMEVRNDGTMLYESTDKLAPGVPGGFGKTDAWEYDLATDTSTRKPELTGPRSLVPLRRQTDQGNAMQPVGANTLSKSADGFDPYTAAFDFLAKHEIQFAVSSMDNVPVCFSDDRTQFLVQLDGSHDKRGFYFGDREKNTLAFVPTPDNITAWHAVRIIPLR